MRDTQFIPIVNIQKIGEKKNKGFCAEGLN